MDKKTYLNQRKTLLDEAQALLDAGKFDEANAKLHDVEMLDAQYETAAKAQANLNALNGKAPAGGVQAASVSGVSGAAFASLDMGADSAEDRYDTAEYKNAFMAYVMHGTAMPKALPYMACRRH